MTERSASANDVAFLLAPGAGAPSTHPRMQTIARLLAPLGKVTTLDYDYMREGRKRPDTLPKLIETHRAALSQLRAQHAGKIVLIGKSMGGRVGCHVAQIEPVDAVICLGYPLCGGGDRNKLRDAVLVALRTPILFVQGTRDSLCPLDLLAQTRARMAAPNRLHIVEGGDHSLIVSKKQLKQSGDTQDATDKRCTAEIASFLSGLEAPNPTRRDSPR